MSRKLDYDDYVTNLPSPYFDADDDNEDGRWEETEVVCQDPHSLSSTSSYYFRPIFVDTTYGNATGYCELNSALSMWGWDPDEGMGYQTYRFEWLDDITYDTSGEEMLKTNELFDNNPQASARGVENDFDANRYREKVMAYLSSLSADSGTLKVNIVFSDYLDVNEVTSIADAVGLEVTGYTARAVNKQGDRITIGGQKLSTENIQRALSAAPEELVFKGLVEVQGNVTLQGDGVGKLAGHSKIFACEVLNRPDSPIRPGSAWSIGL